MSFTDYLFLPLFVIAAVIYYILPKKTRWFFLLLVSLAFYCSWNWKVLPYLLAAVLFAWAGSNWIEKQYQKLQEHLEAEPDMAAEQKKELQLHTKKKCKRILLLNTAFLLAMLIFCKAGKLILETLDLTDMMTVVVPLGISYYTMSLIG